VVRVKTSVRTRRRLTALPVRPRGWWFDALLLAGFVALTVALARGHLLGLDTAVADAVADPPRPVWWLLRVLNFLGQGGWVLMPVTVALCVLLARRARSVRPFLVFVGAFLVTNGGIGPLKLWTDRAAPRSLLADRVELFNDLPPGEYDMSYPSGHVVNAIVWYGAMALLLAALLRAYGRRLPVTAHRALVVVPPAILLVTTTGLSYHWVTDSVAGLLLGWLLHRLLSRVPVDDLPLPALRGGWDRAAGLTPPTS
jgi:membrane-associated phospholipid phosphatase